MKIKQKPEDFQVHEINEFNAEDTGRYFVYRLEKRGLSTLECLKILQRKFRLKAHDLQTCGLKDKHSLSSQLISSKSELSEDTNNDQFTLELVGKASDRVGSVNHKGNRFIITVRDLNENEIEFAESEIENIKKFGVINYFDDQRFGSVKHGNEFVAKCLINKEYEKACKIFMTSTSSADRSKDRRRRKDIAANWGNFSMLDNKYGYCEEKPLLNHLKKNEKDWLGALLKINHNLRYILLYALQSFLWNKTVGLFLQTKSLAEIQADYLLGKLYFYRGLNNEDAKALLRGFEVPLIRHNTNIENDKIRNIYEEVLAEEGLTIQKFRIRAHHAFYFKEYLRKLVVIPENFSSIEVGYDELNEDKRFMTLEFNLPPGSYATILLKRLFKAEKVN